jgi:uncharacterized protein YdaU (DUF1376 family)
MFSYQHHIGDFRRDTASLSDSDAMAYLKLLWLYYDTEEPLPIDSKLLAFKIGSTADSVQLILDAYFQLDNNCYRHKRCDAEISAYHARSLIAKDKANKRWSNAKAMPQHTSGNAGDTKNDANREPITDNQIKDIRPSDVDISIWKDFVKHRKAKKAPITQTALTKIESEAKKANFSLQSALELMCARGWTGFEADWVTKTQDSRPVFDGRLRGAK